MNFLDRAIGFLDPLRGAHRIRNRFAMEKMEEIVQKRSYDAAGNSRRWKDKGKQGDVSINIENELSLAKIRARSRELDRNSPYALRAVERIADNVIGTGIKPTAKNKELPAKLKKAWSEWTESTEIDFDGLMGMSGIQRLIMRTVAESGECIVRRRRTAKNKKSNIPFKLQVFEPDIIDSNRNIASLTAGNNTGGWIIQGVEFSSLGERIGYWLWDRYPSEGIFGNAALTSTFVSIEDIIHVYKVDRPGQVRGVPFGVSAFLRLKDFDEFEDAELVRQKIAACFSVFISESIDSAPMNAGAPKYEVTEKVEPGLIQRVNPGDEVTFTNPPTKDGIEGYSRGVLRGIAAGYGVTYEALTGDLSNVNFSSARMGRIETQGTYSAYQNNMFIPMFCARSWEWFLEGAEIALIYSKKDILVTWTPPSYKLIDPVKEIAGLTAEVRAGFKDWGEAVTELGLNPETVLDRIEKYNDEFDKRKIILDIDPRKVSAGGKAQVVPGTTAAKDKKPAATKEKK